MHMEFVTQLYRDQVTEGRYFFARAPAVRVVMELRVPGVGGTRGDQCQYGAEAKRGPHKGQPVKKPTGFMSNFCELLKALSRRCAGQGNRCSRLGGGGHATCSGNVCKDAAVYTRELCRAVLRDSPHSSKQMAAQPVGATYITTNPKHSHYRVCPPRFTSGKQ